MISEKVYLFLIYSLPVKRSH